MIIFNENQKKNISPLTDDNCDTYFIVGPTAQENQRKRRKKNIFQRKGGRKGDREIGRRRGR